MELNIPRILQAVLDDYALPRDGFHGVAHWARVYEIGMRLAGTTGAKAGIVQLFAVLHDSKRINEGSDPDHGPRAAEFARSLRGKLFDLDDDDFALLHRACHGHTHERTNPDVTIQTCWDSDRLDLGRVGIHPNPAYLCTSTARQSEMIDWAHGRAIMEYVPELVRRDWQIDLDSGQF